MIREKQTFCITEKKLCFRSSNLLFWFAESNFCCFILREWHLPVTRRKKTYLLCASRRDISTEKDKPPLNRSHRICLQLAHICPAMYSDFFRSRWLYNIIAMMAWEIKRASCSVTDLWQRNILWNAWFGGRKSKVLSIL